MIHSGPLTFPPFPQFSDSVQNHCASCFMYVCKQEGEQDEIHH
jgi:hypothetical protein